MELGRFLSGIWQTVEATTSAMPERVREEAADVLDARPTDRLAGAAGTVDNARLAGAHVRVHAAF